MDRERYRLNRPGKFSGWLVIDSCDDEPIHLASLSWLEARLICAFANLFCSRKDPARMKAGTSGD